MRTAARCGEADRAAARSDNPIVSPFVSATSSHTSSTAVVTSATHLRDRTPRSGILEIGNSLHRILDDDPEVTVVGEASNGAEAVELARELTPQVISLRGAEVEVLSSLPQRRLSVHSVCRRPDRPLTSALK